MGGGNGAMMPFMGMKRVCFIVVDEGYVGSASVFWAGESRREQEGSFVVLRWVFGVVCGIFVVLVVTSLVLMIVFIVIAITDRGGLFFREDTRSTCIIG